MTHGNDLMPLLCCCWHAQRTLMGNILKAEATVNTCVCVNTVPTVSTTPGLVCVPQGTQAHAANEVRPQCIIRKTAFLSIMEFLHIFIYHILFIYYFCWDQYKVEIKIFWVTYLMYPFMNTRIFASHFKDYKSISMVFTGTPILRPFNSKFHFFLDL